MCAYATFSLGAVWVPMYEQQRLKECEYILKDSGREGGREKGRRGGRSNRCRERVLSAFPACHRGSNRCTGQCSRPALSPSCFVFLPAIGAKLLLVSKERIYDKSRHFVEELPTLKDVWCFDMDFHPRMKVGR